MHIATSELSAPVRDALKSVGYGRADIEVIGAESIDAAAYAGDGQRGFVVIVNLDTGKRHVETGSWGGSNIFTTTLADDAREPITIPSNGAVIKGTRGYPRTYATVYAHPDAFGRFLPSAEPTDELSDADQQALYCFGAIKGGEYRRDELRRRNVSPETVESLIERGYLKRNRAGATAITTAGKNARTLKH